VFNPFSLEGKRILVTGASSGIGRGVAIQCSKTGAQVVVTGRNIERLHETLTQMSGDGHCVISADLSCQEGVDSLVEQCPLIHGVVHCAGIPKICDIKHIKRELLNEIININEIAPMLLTSGLLKKKKLQKGCSIVFVASISGVCVSNVGESPYSATKGALSGFAKGAALELAAQGSRVNTICPGLVPTEILTLSNELFSEEQLVESTKGKYPLNRYGTVEDIANGAIYLLSDASSWVTGTNLIIDGGYTLN